MFSKYCVAYNCTTVYNCVTFTSVKELCSFSHDPIRHQVCHFNLLKVSGPSAEEKRSRRERCIFLCHTHIAMVIAQARTLPSSQAAPRQSALRLYRRLCNQSQWWHILLKCQIPTSGSGTLIPYLHPFCPDPIAPWGIRVEIKHGLI